MLNVACKIENSAVECHVTSAVAVVLGPCKHHTGPRSRWETLCILAVLFICAVVAYCCFVANEDESIDYNNRITICFIKMATAAVPQMK